MKKWYPVRLKKIIDLNYCEWAYFEDQNFKDPFFEESWNKAKSHPYNSSNFHSLSSLNVLKDWETEFSYSSPSAIIFHCSRCGSTLLSQFLGMNNAHISLAEVPFFDELLRNTLKTSPLENEEYLGFLKSSIKWYGQLSDERKSGKLFIKTDSWHFYFWKQYRKLFTKVPFVLLYRNPLQIFESQKKQKGMHAVQGIIEPEVFNLNTSETAKMKQEEYFGKVLEFYFLSILEILKKEPKTLLLNFKQGGLNMIEKVFEYLELDLTEDEKSNFKERVKFHSKDSTKVFKEELVLKGTPIYLEKSMALYHQIEDIRLKQC